MKYYLVEFLNNTAICSKTIRTEKTIEDIKNWINKQTGIYKNKHCSFLKATEVNEDDFKSFIECFQKSERNNIIDLSTI